MTRQEVQMRLKIFGAVIAVIALAVLSLTSMSVSAGGRAPAAAWTSPRTPDGHPDLRGYWTNATFTPLERPAELAGKEFMTDAEAAAYEKQRALQEASQA